MITFIEYNNISAIGDEVALSVDSAGITTYTVTAGKKGVSFQNLGSDIVWYGGSDSVAPASNRGHKLFPNQSLIYKNVRNTFTIGFRCAATETATVAVVNHD